MPSRRSSEPGDCDSVAAAGDEHRNARHFTGSDGLLAGGINAGQAVTVCRHTTQRFAALDGIGNMHIDAVQVVAGFFRGNRKLRLVEQTAQDGRVCSEVRMILG